MSEYLESGYLHADYGPDYLCDDIDPDDEVRGWPHYTRTDTLPRWRTVGVDGMPEGPVLLIVEGICDLEEWRYFQVAVATEDGQWASGRRGGDTHYDKASPTDRYIPLADLALLPGGSGG
jgi:hypothetical protein